MRSLLLAAEMVVCHRIVFCQSHLMLRQFVCWFTLLLCVWCPSMGVCDFCHEFPVFVVYFIWRKKTKNSSDFALVINKLEERFYDCLALFSVAVLALRHLTASRMNVDVFTAAQLFTLILLAIGYLCMNSENTRLYFSVLFFRGWEKIVKAQQKNTKNNSFTHFAIDFFLFSKV